jgi:hypothetical protein
LSPDPEAFAVAQVLGRSLTQSGRSIFDLSIDSPVLLVFLRHAGCSFCREAIGDLARARRDIEQSGTRIVLVHMGCMGSFDTILKKHGLFDAERICDPNQRLYQAFGVRRGSLLQVVGPKVWWRGMLGGVLARHGVGWPWSDPFQMPAIFLIHQSVIVRRFRHHSAADRPDYLAFCAGGIGAVN